MPPSILHSAALNTEQMATRRSTTSAFPINIHCAQLFLDKLLNILEGKVMMVNGLPLTCGWGPLSRRFACCHQQPAQRHGSSRLEAVSLHLRSAAMPVANFSTKINQARGQTWGPTLWRWSRTLVTTKVVHTAWIPCL